MNFYGKSRDLMSRSLGLENRRDFLEIFISTRLLRPLFSTDLQRKKVIIRSFLRNFFDFSKYFNFMFTICPKLAVTTTDLL